MVQSFFLDDLRKDIPPRCETIGDAIKRGSNAAREDSESYKKEREARFKKLLEESE